MGETWLRNASNKKREKRERVFENSTKLFGVSTELSEVHYLHRNLLTEFLISVGFL